MFSLREFLSGVEVFPGSIVRSACLPERLRWGRTEAMSTLIDSEAQFDQQLKEAGLAQQDVDAIKAYGPKTLSQLFFACGQPGQPISADTVWTLSFTMLSAEPRPSSRSRCSSV